MLRPARLLLLALALLIQGLALAQGGVPRLHRHGPGPAVLALPAAAAQGLAWAWPPAAAPALLPGRLADGPPPVHAEPGWHAHGWAEAVLLQAAGDEDPGAAPAGAWAPPPSGPELGRGPSARPEPAPAWSRRPWQGLPATPPPRPAV